MRDDSDRREGSALSEGLGAWQPIATAPRDGTRILVCGGDVPEPEIARCGIDGSVICELGEDRRIWGDPPDRPSYWMPLPAPPQSA